MGLALFIDTTIGGFVLGLADPDKLSKGPLWSKLYSERFGAAQYLASSLKEGLDELGAKPTDISHIVVGRGPGSFTGVKIGLSFVTGLFTGKPEISIAGVSSLGMIGDGLKSIGAQKVVVAAKATKAHGFCSITESDENRYGTEQSFAFEIADSAHECFNSEEFYVVGSWDEFATAVKERSDKQVVSLDIAISLKAVLDGMISNFTKLSFENYPPQPKYLKKSTAEERLEQQKS